MKISATILAAGSSRRMGKTNKLLLLINNKPIIELVCNTVLETKLSPIIVVTGYQHNKIKKVIPIEINDIVFNKDWKSGIMSSIDKGMSKLDQSVDGNIIILGDMPLITKATLNLLIEEFKKHGGQRIVHPSYKSMQANPVIFPKKYFSDILKGSGDIGAKKILKKYSKETIRVSVDSDEVILDCDTRDDYLLAQMKKTNHVQT
tara:strand:+ start:1029 stop:1640 length:612 start_codon:yes stop_codon:yes gene_type:complete